MRDTTKGRTRIMDFESITALAAITGQCARDHIRQPERANFAGATLAETLRMAREGWCDKLANAMEIAESAVTMAEQEHMVDSFSQPVWDVTGAQVDVGAYLAGTPECMIDYPLTETSKVGRVITLVVSSITSSAVSAITMERRGMVIAAFALALARLGHAIEIWVDSVGEKSGKLLIQRVPVKGVNDEIDSAMLMFALGHPAFHRNLLVGSRAALTGTWSETFACGANPHSRPQDYADSYPEGTIFLPELYSDYDVPNADEFLRKYLGELGLLAE